MRIAFATDNLQLPARLAAAFADVETAGVFGGYLDLIDAVKATPERGRIEAAVLSDELLNARDADVGFGHLEAIVALRMHDPGIRIVLLTRRAANAGASELVGAELLTTFDPTLSAANLARLLGLTVRDSSARIITVAGLQGGAGRSYAAGMLAQFMSEGVEKRAGRRPVLLWELDLKHPTYSFEHNFNPASFDNGRRTISRLLSGARDLGVDPAETVRTAIVASESSNLQFDILLAPQRIREILSVYSTYEDLIELRDRLDSILEVLRARYEFIVIDTGTDLITDPAPALAIAAAHQVITMATPCAGGHSSLYAMVRILGDRRMLDRSRAVLNRVSRSADPRMVERCRDAVRNLMPLHEMPDNAAETREWAKLAEQVVAAAIALDAR